MTETASLAHDVDGSGPLLVALHGLTENRHFWDRVPLAGHFRTLRVDLRGHGQSPHAMPYDPLTMAGDIRALLDTLGLDEHPLVVGHSYGGIVATAYASRFPVTGVVNIDQPLQVTPLPAEVAAALRGPGYQGFLAAAFSRMAGDLDPALAEELSRNRTVRQDVLLEVWAPPLTLGAEELTAYIADLTPTRRPVPYLAVHGLPVDDTYPAWLSERIPGAVVETAPTTTHYPHLADPDWFIGLLTAFAKRL